MTESVQIRRADVRVNAGKAILEGSLGLPERSRGVVLFAHGSGSSRFSPRNQYVARVLQQSGLATLLLDLLTSPEEAVDARTAELRFDVEMLAERLAGATAWLLQHPATGDLRVGYFGASTGAAAALIAAAHVEDVAAIVSRGGRPDLAGDALEKVNAPTLLIVGGEDHPVIALNQQALQRIHVEKQMEIVPGASHLFAEPGKLEKVAELARSWFLGHMPLPQVGEQEYVA